MVKNKFIISESDRKQILSMYGLMLEATKTKVKLFGKIPNTEPPIDLKKLIILVKQNNLNIRPISQSGPDADGNWDITLELENGKFEIRVKNEDGITIKKELTFNGESEIEVVDLTFDKSSIKDEVSLSRSTLIFLVKNSKTNTPLSDIKVITTIEDEDNEKTEYVYTTDKDGKIQFDFKILNEIFELYKKNELTFNITINDENYRSKNEIINIQKGINQKYTFNLVPKKEFKQEVDDFEKEIFIPKFYESNRFTFYGYSTNPMDDKEDALESAKKDAYNQFLKTIRKKFRNNEKVKNTLPEDEEIVFHFPVTEKQYYYIVKYKRRDLKKFVKSLVRVPKDEDIDDFDKNDTIDFEDLSLDIALLKAKTQGKNVFVVIGNDSENMTEVLEKINSNPEFVSNINTKTVKIKIPVDDTDSNYSKLIDIFSQNRLSMRSFPRIVYLNKDKKILANYDFYTIVVDNKYKL